MSPEQEVSYRVLRLLEQHPEYSQRDLAEATGFSLGRTNYVIHALIEKGFLKAGRFLQANNKLTKTSYILTPAGLRHRIELTQGYIERKKAEFDALQAELESLRQEAPEAFAAMPLHSSTKV